MSVDDVLPVYEVAKPLAAAAAPAIDAAWAAVGPKVEVGT